MGCLIVDIFFCLQDLTSDCIYFIVIFGAAGFPFDFVYHSSVFVIQFHFLIANVIGTDTSMG